MRLGQMGAYRLRAAVPFRQFRPRAFLCRVIVADREGQLRRPCKASSDDRWKFWK
jgi:hypothetical protein